MASLVATAQTGDAQLEDLRSKLDGLLRDADAYGKIREALDDAGALKAKVAAGGATLDLEGSWRASDRTVLLAASGVLGVRVACEAPMMAAAGVRAAVENEELRRSRLQPALYTLLKV